jgi:hypothetical protein
LVVSSTNFFTKLGSESGISILDVVVRWGGMHTLFRNDLCFDASQQAIMMLCSYWNGELCMAASSIEGGRVDVVTANLTATSNTISGY